MYDGKDDRYHDTVAVGYGSQRKEGREGQRQEYEERGDEERKEKL